MRAPGALRSLTARLLLGVALPMIALATALAVGGTLVIRTTVGSVNDRILEAAARGIGDSLSIEAGEIALDLSPAIFGMLENTARDNVYYDVRRGGASLTGYADLPRIAAPPVDGVAFGDSRYLGREVRLVAVARRLPGIPEPLVVEVAETLDARRADERRLRQALIALEAALVAVALLLLPAAVRWGLLPLGQIRRELDLRVGTDPAPLPLVDVPYEMRALVVAFNALLARLGESLASMRRFTGDASHQMRTPLSILRAHVAVLRAAPPGSVEARQSIDDIETGAGRLGHLLVQLLALARADNAATAAPRLEPIDLRVILVRVVEDRREAAARAGVSLVLEAPSGIVVETAEALAAEMLGNLVDNALGHGGTGGIVTITARLDRRVTIDDRGPGIPRGDRDRVFARFARLAPYGDVGGTGLGLSIARALSQAIGAELRLLDGPGGRGLRAEILFPAAG